MMVSHITKRTLALVLALVMIFSVLPMMSWAAAVNTGVSGLSADSSGSATWTGGNAAITGSVKASKTSGCTGDSYTQQSGTLTYTNNSGGTALLSFDYSVTLNNGSVKIDGSGITTGGSFSKKLDAGGTAAVEITSSASDDNSTQIEMTNLKLTPEQEVTVTFKAPENGSYTVDGAAITADTPITKLTTDSFALAATAASGYKFFGWYSETEDEYFATNASVTRSFTSSQTVYPVFVGSDSPVFQVGSKLFYDLNDAISYSQSSGTAKITLISNGTLPAGNYTIPNGKTLLIPFDEAQTVYTTSPGMTLNDEGKPASHVNPSAFRTLTMANGANITVASGGVLSVPSMLSAVGTNSGSWNATPTGKHGRITMNAGSSIDVQSGGKLYVYGYISGSGSVYARSGAEVWECFQIRCWRGGTATSGMADNSQKVFPLNQYYVQNIEAPLTIYPGATEKVFAAVNMSSQQFGASATFIGNGGMFTISNGSVTKRFTGASDRLELNVDGDFSITPMSLKITGLPLVGTLDLNTADYVLPINSNITINVDAGTTTLSQDVAFLPGTEMNVAEGATVEIANRYKAYVYDQDQWGAYAAAGLQLVVVGYSTVNGTTAKRTAASLVDAKLDINGTLKIGGQLYTTESGAAIVSSGGTGKVVMQAAAGTEANTYQATQSGSDISYVSIPITAAKLQNADGTYVETADKSAGTEIPYVNGEWGGEEPPLEDGYYLIGSRNDWNLDTLDETVKFELNLSSGENEYQLVTDLTEGEEFKVVKLENGAVVWYPDGSDNNYVVDAAHAGAGKTVYFRPNGNGGDDWHYHVIYVPATNFTVTFLNYDGTELASYTLPYGSMPAYNGPNPEKPADLQFTYNFKEWTPELAEVTGDAVYTAVFESVLNQYTIRFLNFDGTVLQSRLVDYGTLPVYEGEIPEKPADDEFSYSFVGWEPELTEVSGDADYTAKFASTVQTYAVVWKNWDGTVLETDDQVPYGEIPSFDGEEPTRPADNENVYTFIGWEPEISAVTGNIEYTAQFASETRMYRITWIVDGVETQSDWAYNEMPSFDGTPEKAPDAQYSYTFDHWEPEIVPVTEDAVYTAVFTETLNKYRIIFLNEDGTELWSEEFEYGTVPVYGGETPVKLGDDVFHYVFAGWEPALHEVTGEEFYIATFTEEINTFTVTWLNYDGTLLEEDTEVPYGDIPSYDGETPEKPADAQFSYYFLDWTPELTEVTADATYTAVFEGVLNKYTIRFLNYDGTELQSSLVDYGTLPVYEGEIPEKPADAEFSYSFAGWEPDVVEVSGDADYTAKFVGTVQTYTVVWKNWDGSVLETDEGVPYGEMPSYDGQEPTKPADDENVYSFFGWEPELSPVTGDIEYTAMFEADTRFYRITWIVDGVETQSEWAYDEMPYFDGTPEKEPDAQYSYTFDHWEPEIAPVTGDAVYTAVFTETLNKYLIIFLNEDGSQLWNGEFEYGTVPVYGGETPVKQSDDAFHYVFAGWEPALHEVTGEEIYIATFTEELNTFTVTWLNYDGTLLEEDTEVPYGTMPSYDSLEPEKPEDAQFSYSFVGWTPSPEPVTGNVTYVAVFESNVRQYVIRFVNDDGTVLMTYSLDYGAMPVYDGEIPEKAPTAEYSYSFIGWEPQITEVTEDATYTAVYDAEINEYVVSFYNWDGELLQDGLVPYGDMPAYVGVTPTREGDAQFSYEFIGWEPELSEVTEDAIYVAVFEEIVNKYNVVYLNYDLTTVLQSYEVEYGAEVPAYVFTGPNGEDLTPVKPADAQYSYVFSGWTPELAEGETVTGDMTFVAQFTGELNSYEITWIAGDDTYVEIYLFGQTPSFSHDTPTKASTEQYNYVFVGWDKEILPVTCDETYTALFEEELKLYYVSFMDEDGITVLKDAVLYPYGTPANEIEQPPAPTKPADEMFTYSFAGWYPELAEVTEDVTYFAVYESDIRFYTITFVVDGVEYPMSFAYGEMPDFGELPQKETADNENGAYSFVGWEPELVPVTGPAVYTAAFTYTGFRRDESGICYYVDDVLQKTGLTEINGDLYYLDPETGIAAVGWQNYNDNALYDWYYFDPETGAAATGVVILEETFYYKGEDRSFDITYTFDEETHKLVNGTWINYGESLDEYQAGDNQRLRWANYFPTKTWIDLSDGCTYYLNSSGFRVKGTLPVLMDDDSGNYGLFVFDQESGALFNRVEEDGFYDVGEKTYYLIDTYVGYWGLIEVDGFYYYVRSSDFTLVKGQEYNCSKTNGLKDPGSYLFDEQGRMVENGMVEIDGKLYFLQDGKKYYEGLYVEYFDENGSQLESAEGAVKAVYYYFTSRSFEAVCNQSYYITKTNGLLPNGYYFFDENCQYVVILNRNGIVEEDGNLYYYENGQKVYAGLVVEYYDAEGNKLDSAEGAAQAVYYYFTSRSFEAVKDADYSVTKTNDLLPKGTYHFDENGQYIVDLTKNGILEEDGNLYYYVNGEKVYAGLVQDENGDYYYFTSRSFEAVKGRSYYITKTNGLLPQGTYSFDETGKMIRN